MKCERCEKNPARVRIDQVVNGKLEHHYLCQSCVDELMSNAMSQMGDFDAPGIPGGAPFGFVANNGNSASSTGGVNTATAERLPKLQRVN
jgi:ATP-dependent Clp protease ATP-binding subunit ClpC